MRGWIIALAIWFLLYGLFLITNFQVEQKKLVMGILSIVVAVLIVYSNRRPPPWTLTFADSKSPATMTTS